MFIVNAVKSLYNGIRHWDYTWISNHAVGLASMQMPYRQFALFIIYGDHRVDEINISLWLEDAI